MQQQLSGIGRHGKITASTDSDTRAADEQTPLSGANTMTKIGVKMRIFHRCLVVLLAALSLSPTLRADPAAKGLAIATEVKQRNVGWRNSSAAVKMILQSANGRQSIREIRVKRLEVADDGDKSLTVFDAPKDVAGTAFLSFSKITGADDQ